jgi:hypothetical protein
LSVFEDPNEAPHRFLCAPQLLSTDFGADPISPWVCREGNSAYRPIPRLRTRQQLCASMIRIGAILRQTSLDEQIGDTLHALPGHAHAARDPSYAAGLIEDPAEHLPPGRS